MSVSRFVVIAAVCLLPAAGQAQEFRMDVRDSAFSARYGSLFSTDRGQFEIDGSALVGNDSRKAVGVGFHAVDNAYTVETPVFVGLGTRLLWLDSRAGSGMALALGGHGRMLVPDMDRLAVSGHAYFAPGITSFSGADGFFEIAVRGEYQVLENAWLYAGYRRADADFGPSVTLDNGIHAGMRFTF